MKRFLLSVTVGSRLKINVSTGRWRERNINAREKQPLAASHMPQQGTDQGVQT